MQNIQTISLKFHDAVIANNGILVHQILNNDIKIPVKIITGMLMIAVENNFNESVEAILHYNSQSSDKINNAHLNAILCFAAKIDLLKKLNFTYH